MKFFTSILLLFIVMNSSAQSSNTQCSNAIQICLNTPVTFPASTNSGNAQVGPDYGCLGSRPNPAWYGFRIGTPGTHTILETNSTTRDLDFILYGPFSTFQNNCANLNAANTAACSYAGGATETINFTSVNSGDYYLLLITNYSNQATNITFNQTSGTGTFDCNFTAPCQISAVSPIVGACQPTTNTFTLTGSVYTFNPPLTGTLTVSSQGVVQTINAPFNNSINFTLSGLPSNASAGNVSAVFSAVPSCIGSGNYIAPAGCSPCQASAIANGPVCEGETLFLTTDYPALAQYQWTGPNGFVSNLANPSIYNVTSAATGIYSVTITGQNCIATPTVEVDILNSPIVEINTVANTLCEGDNLVLGANENPGVTWSWNGPNQFTASTRNTQINNVTTNASGLYVLSASRAGCNAIPDSLMISVFPKPTIQVIGDSLQSAGSVGILSASGNDNLTYTWNFSGDIDVIGTRVYTGNADSLVVFWNNLEGEILIEVIGYDVSGCSSIPVYLPISVSNSIGIEPIIDSSFNLFPNPGNDFVNISSSSNARHMIELIDLSGRIVLSQSYEGYNTQVNLSGINQGIYIVKLDGIDRLFSIVK